MTSQVDGEFRDSPKDILDPRTRSDEGGMVPLGCIAMLEQETDAFRVTRHDLYPAAFVQGATAPGVSAGQAIGAMEGLLDDALPDGFGHEWTGLALQETLAGNTAIFAFGLAVVFVLSLLAAAARVVVSAAADDADRADVPAGGDHGRAAQGPRQHPDADRPRRSGGSGAEAILIVEFAAQARGLDRVEAARLPLRPILTTSLALILGVLPLVIAEGAGSEMRRALGTAVSSGMLGATVFGLLFTPVFHVAFQWLAEKAGVRGPEIAAAQ